MKKSPLLSLLSAMGHMAVKLAESIFWACCIKNESKLFQLLQYCWNHSDGQYYFRLPVSLLETLAL